MAQYCFPVESGPVSATVRFRLKNRSGKRKPRRRQTRAEQIEEANGIFFWLAICRGFATDLIRTTAKRVTDEEEALIFFRDLVFITLALNSVDVSRLDEKWKDYQHHFIGDRNRWAFFMKLRRMTRRIASSRLNGTRPVMRTPGENHDETIAWDASLLPPEAERYVVRVATLHPELLEDFLIGFFEQSSDLARKKSTFNRALHIALAVRTLGWSADKHTKHLIEIGALEPAEGGSEVEMVKKFIRDLRSRYQKDRESLQRDPDRQSFLRGPSRSSEARGHPDRKN